MRLPWWVWERARPIVQQPVNLPDPVLSAWSVTRGPETDGGGNVHQVIIARRGSEEHRFSPNTTDDELVERLKEIG